MDCNHGSNLNWVIQNYPNISSGSNWSFGALQFTLTTNTWQHLLITYNNGQKKAYVNGILQATATESILWSGNPGLFLGNWPEGARRFHGGIDELYITYDLQQTSNFTPPSTITTTSPNTFGLWHFDEGQGTSTQKSSGTSYPLNNWIWQNRSSASSVNYLWSTGATTASINVSPTQTTTYYVTVSNGITSCTDSVTVTVANLNSQLFSQDTLPVCGTSTTLDAGSGYSSYNWNTGATTQSISVASTGWYTCAVNQGTCTATDSVFVSLVDAEIVQNDTTVCAGTTVQLSINSSSNSSSYTSLPVNLQNGLVAYWPFNGNANDASGNGRNGTVNGAVLSVDRFSNPNKCYYFDGNGSNISASCDGFSTNERTISFWFKGLDIGQGPSGRGFMGYGGNGICGTSSLIMIDNAASGGNNYEISGHCNNEQVLFNYGANHPNNQWIHWVITNKPLVGTKFFINGNLVNSSNTFIQQTYTAGRSIFLGTVVDWAGLNPFWDSNCQPFKGYLDDVAIYNRAISASEIQQLYSQGQYSYLWSTGATTASINVTPTQTTTYYVTVSNGITSCTDSVTVTVVPGSTAY
jgi:hypothetical protein